MAFSEGDDHAIDEVVDLLSPSQRLLFITGAGLSAASGLPTYRGVGGLYNGGETADGISIEDALSGSMMKVRPDVTWRYLRQMEQAARGATFNTGHRTIAQMESHFAEIWVLTQNVDGFHRAAGSTRVIDIHGELRQIRCSWRSCPWHERVDSFDRWGNELPRCPECRCVLRPDVVLFEEMLPTEKLATLQRELNRGFDIIFSIGTSSLFPYITEPVFNAEETGIPTVEINPGETDVSPIVTFKISAPAVEALDAIWSRYQAKSSPA